MVGGTIVAYQQWGSEAVSAPAPVTLEKKSRDRQIGPAKEAHAQKWQSLARRALTMSFQEREDMAKELAPSDRGKALDALMSQMGPGSSSQNLQQMMQKILESWAATDLDGAMAYCEKCPNDGMRKFMLGALFKTIAEADPDRALSLYAAMAAEDPSFQSDVVFTLARDRMGKDAGQFVDLISKLPARSGASGMGAEFAKGYDFQTAADGVVAFMNAHSKNKIGQLPPGFVEGNSTNNPAIVPTNLLESWAATDPDAAQAWWVKNGSFPFNEWSKLLNGVEKHSSPEAAAAWTVAKLEEAGAPRQKMMWELVNSSREGVAGRINTIARAMPDVAAQDRFLTETVMINYSSQTEQYGFVISGLSSPEVRLDVFQKLGGKSNLIDLKKFDDAQFQAWGFTRQQAELAYKRK